MRVRIVLLFLIASLVSACGALPPVEVTRVVPQTQEVPVEVTRLVRETSVVTVEVTRVVQQTVVVTPVPLPALSIAQSTYLPKPRAHHTATRLKDGRVLLVGGSQSPDEHLADVEIFDPVTGAIRAVAPQFSMTRMVKEYTEKLYVPCME